MASLSLKNICKTYPNGFVAVKNFNLDIADKEFIIFVGPSGCLVAEETELCLHTVAWQCFYIRNPSVNHV